VSPGADRRGCSMLPTAPQAREARGTATLHDGANLVEIQVWGLPGPSFFGRDPTTGRVFNLFEVWLVDPATEGRICVGSLGRRGSCRELRVVAEADLSRYCQVRITAEECRCPSESSGVVVMEGCCCWFEPDEVD